MTTSGQGFQVEVDNLRAFAAQVRGLLSEYEGGAGTSRVYGPSGISSSAFGTFAEAQALHAKYSEMREALSVVLSQIQDAIDEVQQNADHTARNYEEQEQNTRRHVTLAHDGWASTWSQSELNASQVVPTPTVTDATRPQW